MKLIEQIKKLEKVQNRTKFQEEQLKDLRQIVEKDLPLIKEQIEDKEKIKREFLG